MDKKLLTDDIIIEKLEKDGFMEEPDGPWLLEYIEEQHGGKLDKTSDYVDDRHSLKIYSESTYDGYDIWWCTYDEKPYISQDGFYYEDYTEWSSRALDELTSGSDVWVEPHLWDDMEYEFNYELEQWWQDVYQELFDEKKDELLDSGDYYEEKEEE
ncbi:hypothetical protein DRO61_03360 [Candidatus Bathyarchaeota archaeon]|nr:MAG: hypothetical protein DRO61_03360 [Candidatus Bathyarchaeota archaeon]